MTPARRDALSKRRRRWCRAVVPSALARGRGYGAAMPLAPLTVLLAVADLQREGLPPTVAQLARTLGARDSDVDVVVEGLIAEDALGGMIDPASGEGRVALTEFGAARVSEHRT